MSSASRRGSSRAAKWPPRGISVHLVTWKLRSASSRGGWPSGTGTGGKCRVAKRPAAGHLGPPGHLEVALGQFARGMAERHELVGEARETRWHANLVARPQRAAPVPVLVVQPD